MAGRKGERILRQLVCGCEEWRDEGSRNALATALEVEPRNAGKSFDNVRQNSSVDLRKCDYFLVCRRWGYRSDVWKRRVMLDEDGATLPRSSRNLEYSQGSPAWRMPHPMHMLADPSQGAFFVAEDAVRTALLRDVAPILRHSMRCASCSNAEAAAALGEQGSVLLPEFWRPVSVVMTTMATGIAPPIRLHALTTSAWLDQVNVGTVRDGCEMTVLVMQGRPGPAERVLLMFLEQTRHLRDNSLNQQRQSRVSGAGQVDMAYHADTLAFQTSAIDAFTRMLGILRQLEHGPVVSYLQASRAVLDLMEQELVGPIISQVAKRFVWLEAASQRLAASSLPPRDEENPHMGMLVRLVGGMAGGNADLREMMIESGCTTLISRALRPEVPAAAAGAAAREARSSSGGIIPATWNELSSLLCPGAPAANNAAELLATVQDERWQLEALQRQQGHAGLANWDDLMEELLGADGELELDGPPRLVTPDSGVMEMMETSEQRQIGKCYDTSSSEVEELMTSLTRLPGGMMDSEDLASAAWDDIGSMWGPSY